MRKISLAVVAVAAALGAGLAQADTPTLAQVQAVLPTAEGGNGAGKEFWFAGSSAAKNGIKAFITSTFCGGTLSAWTSSGTGSVPDFNAWACTATAGPTAGSLTIWYYRAEGGSVVGVYPVISNTAIKYLDLTVANTTCPNVAGGGLCIVAGTSSTNGPNDTWGPAGVSGSTKASSAPNRAPDLGISDAEPDAFVGANSPYVAAPPAGYTAGTFGPAQTQAALKAMTHTTIFQQTFGIVVNNSITQTTLGRNVVANILQGSYINWNSTPDIASATPGAAIKAASTPIFVCNREVGSGTRTVTDIFFNGDHCVPGAPAISEGASATVHDNYSTGELLTCVQNNGSTNGAPAGSVAIGYAGVDNNTAAKLGGLAHFVSLDSGPIPTNYTTAIGATEFAFEATANTNTASTNPNAAAIIAAVIPLLQAVGTAPQSLQINAIPAQPAGNTAVLPLQTVGTTPIYTTDFYRGGGLGNSCSVMFEAN
jgi:hypothetical protein